jgi:hypothetical protein
MQKANGVTKLLAETDSLVELIFEYRTIVKSFEWQAFNKYMATILGASNDK